MAINMSLSIPRQLQMTLLLTITILPFLISAEDDTDGSTGRNRIETQQCPPNPEANMVYSPFKPYFHWDLFKGDVQKCWVAADCLMEAAGESRKQQFAATALVMGLIPLTLRDIAWPERRIIHVKKPLKPIVETLVLAMGLVPVESDKKELERRTNGEANMIARRAYKAKANKAALGIWVIICSILMAASYAGMAFMEIYSKRSALGCPFPVFVVAWHVAALVPGAIHAFLARFRRNRAINKMRSRRTQDAQERGKGNYGITTQEGEGDAQDANKVASAVQGADEEWPVQLAWGIYYIAGTLIFTSIMAVTVLELLCWVGLGFAVSGSSKLLAFFLCLVFEDYDG